MSDNINKRLSAEEILEANSTFHIRSKLKVDNRDLVWNICPRDALRAMKQFTDQELALLREENERIIFQNAKQHDQLIERDEIISDLKTELDETEQKWISVDESLPECTSQHGKHFLSDFVLTYDKYGDCEVIQFCEEYEGTENGLKLKEKYWGNRSEVTHWMALPKMP